MARPKVKTCKADHYKVCLSEGQALRRAQRYEQIERAYYCKKCCSWHITSKKDKYAWAKADKSAAESTVDITVDDLQKMIDNIKSRINEQ